MPFRLTFLRFCVVDTTKATTMMIMLTLKVLFIYLIDTLLRWRSCTNQRIFTHCVSQRTLIVSAFTFFRRTIIIIIVISVRRLDFQRKRNHASTIRNREPRVCITSTTTIITSSGNQLISPLFVFTRRLVRTCET